MENMLSRYKRQPKIYVDAPSQFKYIDDSVCSGESFKDIPVYSMTGADEISMKTPEALLNGKAIKNLIQSCIPTVKDAGKLSSIDVEFFLTAIRIASYGQTYSKKSICEKCSEENSHDIDLTNFIDEYNKKEFKDTIVIEDLKFYLKPLTYDEWNDIQLELFQANRTLYQAMSKPDMTEDEKQQFQNSIQNIIQSINQKTVLYQVYKIKDGEVEETNTNNIRSFILESDRTFFTKLQNLIKENTSTWDLPKLNLTCGGCGEEYHSVLSMDEASFFAD